MPNTEHFEVLKSGVEEWNEWRKKNFTIQPNFSEANLRGFDLRKVNFRGACLTNANLIESYLSGADLSISDLRGAKLQGARLQRVNLRGAILRNADLRNVSLRSANIRKAILWYGSIKPDTFLRQFQKESFQSLAGNVKLHSVSSSPSNNDLQTELG